MTQLQWYTLTPKGTRVVFIENPRDVLSLKLRELFSCDYTLSHEETLKYLSDENLTNSINLGLVEMLNKPLVRKFNDFSTVAGLLMEQLSSSRNALLATTDGFNIAHSSMLLEEDIERYAAWGAELYNLSEKQKNRGFVVPPYTVYTNDNFGYEQKLTFCTLYIDIDQPYPFIIFDEARLQHSAFVDVVWLLYRRVNSRIS